MTAAPSVELRSIIGRTRHLLLNFDGPICSIFAGLPAPTVAARLRELLGSDGAPLPKSVAEEDDPIEVLHFASSLDRHTAALVESVLRDAEQTATKSATSTPDAREVILATKLADASPSSATTLRPPPRPTCKHTTWPSTSM